MMRTLRDNTAVVLWILVLAFVATIVFSWGMGGFDTMKKGGTSTIASVDGEKLDIRDYERLVNNRLQQSQAEGSRPDDAQVNAARRQSWSDLINLTLERQLVDRLDLGTSDEEISDRILYMPPAWVTGDTTFQSGGTFDTLRWHDLLRGDNTRGLLLNLEEQYRQAIPLEKLRARLQATALPGEADLLDDYLQKNQTATGDWLVWPYASFDIDTATIAASELKAWYDSHRDEYRTVERRRVNYVQFVVEPSKEDTADAYDQMEYIKRQLAKGDSFEAMTRTYSMDESNADRGGDLGWFGRGRMVKPFDDAVFAAEIGQLTGPIETRFGLHLIEVLGREMRDDGKGGTEEQVHARHILIKIEPSSMTYSDLRAKADAIYEDVQQGADFAVTCAERDLQMQEGKPFDVDGTVPGIGRSQRAADMIFAASPGETLAPLYNERAGWFVFQLVEVLPEGIEPFAAKRADVQQAVRKQKQKALALEAAKAFAASHAGLADLDSSLAVAPAEYGRLEQPIKINQFVRGGIGRDLAFSAALFTTPVGAVSKPVPGERGVYLVACEARDSQADLMATLEADLPKRRSDAVDQQRGSAYGVWSRWARDRAVVEDNRRAFDFDY